AQGEPFALLGVAVYPAGLLADRGELSGEVSQPPGHLGGGRVQRNDGLVGRGEGVELAGDVGGGVSGGQFSWRDPDSGGLEAADPVDAEDPPVLAVVVVAEQV